MMYGRTESTATNVFSDEMSTASFVVYGEARTYVVDDITWQSKLILKKPWTFYTISKMKEFKKKIYKSDDSFSFSFKVLRVRDKFKFQSRKC